MADDCSDGTDWNAAMRADNLRRGYPGYRPKPLGSIGNPVGRLGGEPIDGIDYVSDDLAELLVFAAMECEWTPEEDARADAMAEQIEAAMREAERHDCRRLPLYYVLRRVPDVKFKVRDSVEYYRRVVRGSDFGELEEFVEIVGPSGMRFNKDDPGSYRGMFGLVAGNERRVHVLRGHYTPKRWLDELQRHPASCGWRAADCLEYTRAHLTFSSGQFLVAVPTCWACEHWLLAGGSRNTPTAHLGT